MPVKQSCRSCHAPIFWLVTENNRRMPVDTKKVTIVTEKGATVSGYVSHFATCPEAAEHRRRKKEARDQEDAAQATIDEAATS